MTLINAAINITTFLAYCDYARRMFHAKGIFIYNEKAEVVLTVAGYPYARSAANNDNTATS